MKKLHPQHESFMGHGLPSKNLICTNVSDETFFQIERLRINAGLSRSALLRLFIEIGLEKASVTDKKTNVTPEKPKK